MASISVTTCSFYLHKYNKRKNQTIYPLNGRFSTTGNEDIIEYDNIIEVFKGYLTPGGEFKNDKGEKTIFSCQLNDQYSGETDSFRYLLLKINFGRYGIASSICDNDTANIVHEVKPDQTALKEFAVFIAVPKDNDKVIVQKGILMFQNIGQFGIKTITTRNFKEYLRDKFQITLNTGIISPSHYIETLFGDKNISQIHLTRNYIPIDDADRIYLGYGKERRQLHNLFIKSELIEKLKVFAYGKATCFEFEDIEYDKVHVITEFLGRKRSIDLHNIENLSIIEYLPDSILMADGKIDVDTLLQNFIDLTNEYIKELALQII